MSFCSLSKDFNENSYTTIENQFITKYLPQADNFAVKVYIYGLYLCQSSDSDFTIKSMAEVLNVDEEQIIDAFKFWEDYDLIQILSEEPFVVSYLPVKTTIGKPKKVHYEQYGDFNKELQRKMQKVGKFVSYNESIKYMHFLNDNNIQPQAFLLIAEYCINKQGESVSPSYIMNKAKKFIRNGWLTYEQVERELSNYNAHEGDLISIYEALSYFKKPDENDYSLFEKWTNTMGFNKNTIIEAAKHLKKGNPDTLDLLLTELLQKEKVTKEEVVSYLSERDEIATLTFRVGRKLGIKISNPAPYIDEYTEKWYNYGFEEHALSEIALYCLRTERNDFNSMNDMVKRLFNAGIISNDKVNEYLKVKNHDLKLFTQIQNYCGSLKKSNANLALIETWHAWKLSDEMILEAAKRSSTSANPIPYMNKILSDWKNLGITKIQDIPEKSTYIKPENSFVNPMIEAINDKTDRERYYALLRENAQSIADKFLNKARKAPHFSEIGKELSKMEIEFAKAEMFNPEKLPELNNKKANLLKERANILQSLGITEQQLLPQYKCKRCSDTGFLPDGTVCDCYQKFLQANQKENKQ